MFEGRGRFDAIVVGDGPGGDLTARTLGRQGRRVALVAMALFYGVFVWLWLMGGLVPDTSRGFLFKLFGA